MAKRTKIVVSGYYGFDNLGDEAILEELTCELKKLVPASQIYVLSEKPDQTSKAFGVEAISRWDKGRLATLLMQSRLFISGGGGLFQETKSVGSIVFYGGQIILARALASPALLYAQGLGPFKSAIGKALTRTSLKACNWVTLRDKTSLALAKSWGLPAQLTADPVWCLEGTPLPPSVKQQLGALKGSARLLLGLSLRPSRDFEEKHLEWLAAGLAAQVPEACIVPLSLQPDQDREPLSGCTAKLRQAGLKIAQLDTSQLELPSQWVTLMQSLDMVVGMRLHALIMALKAGLPVLGIAYDPKVRQLLTDFQQPMLILANNETQTQWAITAEGAFSSRPELALKAKEGAEAAKNLACQNFNLLARILGMQSDP